MSETVYYPCTPHAKAEILAALRKQEIDRVVERLVRSASEPTHGGEHEE
jgi:hypothetical protein